MINQLLNDPYCNLPEVEWNEISVNLSTERCAVTLSLVLDMVSKGEKIPKLIFNNETINNKKDLEDLITAHAAEIENMLMSKISRFSIGIITESTNFNLFMSLSEKMEYAQIQDYFSDRNVWDLIFYKNLLEEIKNDLVKTYQKNAGF